MKRGYQVNDYILDFLVEQGIGEVFLVTGGAIAFIADAFHGRKDIKCIPCGHEQAAAMMAEAYSRMGPGYSVCMATSGPGATNFITGMGCAYFDSIPALYITGQVNTYEQRGYDPGTKDVRQVGFQETQIVEMMAPITKYSTMLKRAEDIRYELEKATYIAKSGRPGPVVLDIPMNFQRAPIKKKELRPFLPPKTKPYKDTGESLERKVGRIYRLLAKAERPVVVAGGGIRLSGAYEEFHALISKLKYPIITSWSGFDVMPYDHPLYIGSHGVYGSRGANFTVQNSDVLITIGSRLDTRQTGGRPAMYARRAKLVMVDIDRAELAKRRGLTPYMTVEADAKEFILEMVKQYEKHKKSLPSAEKWLARSREWKAKYPIMQEKFYKQKKYVNPYVFGEILSEELPKNAVVIPDQGGNLTWTMQSFKLKKGQRLFSAFGNSPMGYGFPAALGASIALGKREVICIDGDGGIQFNIQEFQTMVAQKLPVKTFVLNNEGYGIIRQFQAAYLDSHIIATDKRDGVTNPDFIKVAKAFGITALRINSNRELRRKIRQALRTKGPVLVEIMMRPGQEIMPKLAFGNPLEDQWPLLPREELEKNMIVPLIGSDKSLTEAN